MPSLSNPTPDDSLGFKWEAVTKDSGLRHLAIQLNSVMVPDQRAEVGRVDGCTDGFPGGVRH